MFSCANSFIVWFFKSKLSVEHQYHYHYFALQGSYALILGKGLENL